MKCKFAAISICILLTSAMGCAKTEQGVFASGTIEATEILISAKVAGTVKAVNVKRSQALSAGDLMVEIDPEVYKLQLKQALAALGAAEQLLLKAERGLRPEEIDRARQGVNAANAQYRLARDTLDRQEKLLERGAISQQEVDVTKSQYRMAQANLRAARKQYQIARKGAREEDIEAAGKQVERARAAVDLARLQESYSRVKSPGELVVSEIYIEPGELAAPGGALVMLQDLSEFHIDLFVPIARIAEIHAQDSVKLKVTGYPGREFAGVVERIKPRAEFTPENVTTEEGRSHLVFKVRVKITRGAEVLKPGLPADAWIMPSNSRGQ